MIIGCVFWYRYFLYCLRHRVLDCIKPSTDSAFAGLLIDVARSRMDLIAENAFLRQQVLVLSRSGKRPLPTPRGRVLLVLLASKVRAWQQALLIVQPENLLRWHRDLFRWGWRRKSKAATCKPRLPLETVTLILRMVSENWLWGAERIRGELLKLGIRVSKRTIQRYMQRVRKPRPHGQTWNTFLHNHAQALWACDFVQTYDLFFRAIFVFVLIEHQSRKVIHYGITRSPSDQWVAQQLREATAFGVAAQYLLHDNDSKYGTRFSFMISSTGIQELAIPPHSPNLNAICERFIGSLRRECLDHMLIFGEGHLRHVLAAYIDFFNTVRPHQGLEQQCPVPLIVLFGDGIVQRRDVLGGIVHDYVRAAA